MSHSAIANRFNEAITARDLDALVALMTDDHALVDSGRVAECRVLDDTCTNRAQLAID